MSEPQPAGGDSRPTKRLLLVEDNPGDARLVRALLDESNTTRFETRQSTSLAEAMNLLAEEPFDLVLLDLSLPDARGLEALTRLRPAAVGVPIVVKTGIDNEELALQALKAGAQDYLVKGQVDSRNLTRTILHAVERHRMLLDLEQVKRREHFLATHDSLTGLPNRPQFQETLAQTLTFAARYGQAVAVLFIDLDHFKSVNDTFGHAAGDTVLTRAARRLTESVRTSDTAARLGGDEFTVLLRNLTDPGDAGLVAQQIVDRLAQPYALNGQRLLVSPSIGIALFPQDGKEAETLMRNADVAMYHAKKRGRANYQFFTAELNAKARRRNRIERRLREAVDGQQFVVHYQPQVDTRRGRLIGAEALLRWKHPDLGAVRPADFIPVAEESGLIEEIGEWVLNTVCTQHEAWRLAGHDEIDIAINLSVRQLRQRRLAEKIEAVLQRTGTDPRRLQLEITEAGIMEDVERCARSLHRLKELGVRISIDDFGTGPSSLSCLRQLPVDILKIDRSFICDLTHDAGAGTITDAIISMAASLRLETIAEGVETEEQQQILNGRGCHVMQGYRFGRPVPAREFAESRRRTQAVLRP